MRVFGGYGIGHGFILFLLLASAQLYAETRTVTVLSTCDIHASFGPRGPSWLKLASLVRDERQKAGERNTLLIDSGDNMQGSFVGKHSAGAVAVKMLNLLKYDVWVPGNHDFDFGVDCLLKRVSEFKGSALAGNVICSPPFYSFKFFERGGLKIAVIGFGCCDKRFYSPEALTRLKFADSAKYLDQTLAEVKKGRPDVIILVIHNGRFGKKPTDFKLLQRYPDINLVLGGHTHAVEPGVLSGRTWYLQAGSHSRFLGKAVVSYDSANKKVTIKSEMMKVTPGTKVDPQLAREVNGLLKAADKDARAVAGYNSLELTIPGNRMQPSGISTLFSMAIAGAAKTDAAFYGTPPGRAKLAKGKVTGSNIFRLTPYPNTVCTMSLNRDQIAGIIQEQYKRFRQTREFLHPFGLSLKVDNKGGLIGSPVLKNGKELTGSNRVKVAFSSGALSGAVAGWAYLQSLVNDKNCDFRDTGIRVDKALFDYIKSHSPLNISPAGDIKNVGTDPVAVKKTKKAKKATAVKKAAFPSRPTGRKSTIDVAKYLPAEANGYQLVYQFNPTNPVMKNGKNDIVYDVDNSNQVKGPFKKLAYLLVLLNKNGQVEYAYVSMDPFTDDVKKIGVPVKASGARFQQMVKNCRVISNVDGVKNGEYPDGCNIEFCDCNYTAVNAAKVPNASDKFFDFGDTFDKNKSPGYGSMQIHNYKEKQSIICFNKFHGRGKADVGIGNSKGRARDWTFSANARNCKDGVMVVLVKK